MEAAANLWGSEEKVVSTPVRRLHALIVYFEHLKMVEA
jgi:hypothetical protein